MLESTRTMAGVFAAGGEGRRKRKMLVGAKGSSSKKEVRKALRCLSRDNGGTEHQRRLHNIRAKDCNHL